MPLPDIERLAHAASMMNIALLSIALTLSTRLLTNCDDQTPDNPTDTTDCYTNLADLPAGPMATTGFAGPYHFCWDELASV